MSIICIYIQNNIPYKKKNLDSLFGTAAYRLHYNQSRVKYKDFSSNSNLASTNRRNKKKEYLHSLIQGSWAMFKNSKKECKKLKNVCTISEIDTIGQFKK